MTVSNRSGNYVRSLGRIVAFSTAYTLAGLSAVAQSTHAGKPQILIALSTPTPSMKAVSPLKLDLLFTNNTNARVEFSTDPTEFTLEVRDDGGRAVGFGKSPPERAPVGGIIQDRYPRKSLEPRETASYHLLYEDIDFSRPGQYTVRLTKLFGKTVAKSNAITITVVP